MDIKEFAMRLLKFSDVAREAIGDEEFVNLILDKMDFSEGSFGKFILDKIEAREKEINEAFDEIGV